MSAVTVRTVGTTANENGDRAPIVDVRHEGADDYSVREDTGFLFVNKGDFTVAAYAAAHWFSIVLELDEETLA